jgi:hypothetical protein
MLKNTHPKPSSDIGLSKEKEILGIKPKIATGDQGKRF